MNIIQKALLGVVLTLFISTNVWASGGIGERGSRGGHDRELTKKDHSWSKNHDWGKGEISEAPEIDAASGTIPLALLTGVLFLIKERSRSKRYE
jgi:hypothetical protein